MSGRIIKVFAWFGCCAAILGLFIFSLECMPEYSLFGFGFISAAIFMLYIWAVTKGRENNK